LDEVGILAALDDKAVVDNSTAYAQYPMPSAGSTVVRIDPRYFRPTEVDFLLGDASKARKILGWKPKVTFPRLVRIMVNADIEELLNLQRAQDVVYRIINGSEKPEKTATGH
jgi:GDPmannose 4,6-dehydratase